MRISSNSAGFISDGPNNLLTIIIFSKATSIINKTLFKQQRQVEGCAHTLTTETRFYITDTDEKKSNCINEFITFEPEMSRNHKIPWKLTQSPLNETLIDVIVSRTVWQLKALFSLVYGCKPDLTMCESA